jgi:hypothetical protein
MILLLCPQLHMVIRYSSLSKSAKSNARFSSSQIQAFQARTCDDQLIFAPANAEPVIIFAGLRSLIMKAPFDSVSPVTRVQGYTLSTAFLVRLACSSQTASQRMSRLTILSFSSRSPSNTDIICSCKTYCPHA